MGVSMGVWTGVWTGVSAGLSTSITGPSGTCECPVVPARFDEGNATVYAGFSISSRVALRLRASLSRSLYMSIRLDLLCTSPWLARPHPSRVLGLNASLILLGRPDPEYDGTVKDVMVNLLSWRVADIA
jgi:hypothetical protein